MQTQSPTFRELCRFPFVSFPFQRKPTFSVSYQRTDNRLRRNCAPSEALLSDGWPLWTVITGCAALGQISTDHPIGKTLSGPLLVMFLGCLTSLLGIIPVDCHSYLLIWRWGVPLAAVMYLLETDLGSLRSIPWVVPVFFIGAMGTVVGTIVASLTVGRHLGPEGWKVASALCATYIGGSANFASTAAALDFTSSSSFWLPNRLPILGPLLAASVASDNVAMLVYLAVISIIPVEDINHLETQSLKSVDDPSIESSAKIHTKTGEQEDQRLGALTVGILCCALGDWLAKLLKVQHLAVAFMTLIASVVGIVLNSKEPSGSSFLLKGSRVMGSTIMSVFFVVIGASCGSIGSVVASTPLLLVYVAIQITVHLLFILVCCKPLNVPMSHILTASNANIGGPATASGMAAARGWDKMVQPAVLLGCLGYATANIIGINLGYMLRLFQ